MIKSLSLKNFTLFRDNSLDFSPGINVFVGENGTGKSHLLKLLYATSRSLTLRPKGLFPSDPTKSFLEKEIADRLTGIFRPDSLGRLSSRIQGKSKSEVCQKFDNPKEEITFSFSTTSTEKVMINSLPEKWRKIDSVYLPTREILSIYPHFTSVYETTQIPFEETWRDLALLLGKGLLKGSHTSEISTPLNTLGEILGGSLELEGDKFYLKSNKGRVEMHLLAEGLRKIGMVARLIANGSLKNKTCLFWDEPEANLNPKIIRSIAKVIVALASNGIQIFIATHCLFLLRELFLEQHRNSKISAQYFGLHENNDSTVFITSGSSIEDIGDITSLDYQIMQDEALMNVFSGN